MKRVLGVVALGTALALAGAGCGGSTSAFGRYEILLTAHGAYESRILLWRPGAPMKPLTPDEDYGDSCAGGCFAGVSDGFWSPDGRSIAFTQTPYVGTEPPDPTASVMRSDGTHDNVLTTSPDSVYAIGPPSWSPDGRKIVFGRDRGSYYSADPHDLVIVDVLTGQTRALRADGATDDPVWGKPGIAYHAGSRIMLMNSMTGRSRPLAHGNGIDNLAWSPGGVLAVGEHTQIVLLAASGRVLGTLPFPPAMRRVCAISWSSDGRQILVATEKGTYTLRGLWVGTVRTQHWQRLPAAPTWKNYKYDCAISWR